MDRHFFYKNRTQEHQRELSRMLATRRLLKNAEILHPLAAGKVKLLVWRNALAVIVISLLLLLGFLS